MAKNLATATATATATTKAKIQYDLLRLPLSLDQPSTANKYKTQNTPILNAQPQ